MMVSVVYLEMINFDCANIDKKGVDNDDRCKYLVGDLVSYCI